MALLTSARTAQSPLVASFTFNFNDTMVPKAGGAAVDFGLTNLAATTVVAIPLPPNSVVTGGSILTHTTFDTAGYSVSIGDSSVADRYKAATDVKTAGSYALVPTGFLNASGLNIEVLFDNVDVCTAGKCTITVEYIVLGRACEVQIA